MRGKESSFGLFIHFFLSTLNQKPEVLIACCLQDSDTASSDFLRTPAVQPDIHFALLCLWCCHIVMSLTVKLQQALLVDVQHQRRQTLGVGFSPESHSLQTMCMWISLLSPLLLHNEVFTLCFVRRKVFAAVATDSLPRGVRQNAKR